MSRVRERTFGVHATRRRIRNGAISVFLAVLMLVSPEALAQLHNEAMAYQAMSACAIGQTPTEISYGYDENGNLISKTGGPAGDVAYSYSAENRLVQYDPLGGPESLVTYSYDADGIRSSKTLGTTTPATTTYLTDKNRSYAQVLQERDGATGDLHVRYTYGDDLISQTRPDAGQGPDVTRYYHTDGQLSTRQLTDDHADPASVAVTDGYTYDAFGATLATVGSTIINYLYTGEQLDDSTGFYYLRARYYDSTAGRFVSRDPFEGVQQDPPTLHAYLYAHCDPIDNIDPTGLLDFTISGQLIVSGIRSLLLVINIAGFVHSTRNTLQFGIHAWQSFSQGSIKEGIGYALLALANGVAAFASALGLRSFVGSLIFPGGTGALAAILGGTATRAALAGAASAGSQAYRTLVNVALSNPAIRTWLWNEFIPAILTLSIAVFSWRAGDLPATNGPPNKSLAKDDGKGKGQIRDYGPDGKAIKDYDFGHDHGAGDPHVHDWDWTRTPPRQPGRPLGPND